MYLVAFLLGLVIKPEVQLIPIVPEPQVCGIVPVDVSRVDDKIKMNMIIACDNPTGYRLILKRNVGLGGREIEYSDGKSKPHSVVIYMSEWEARASVVTLLRNPPE